MRVKFADKCVVPCCKNIDYHKKNTNIKFFELTTDQMNAFFRGEKIMSNAYINNCKPPKICSDHFNENDIQDIWHIEVIDDEVKRIQKSYLKENAQPLQFVKEQLYLLFLQTRNNLNIIPIDSNRHYSSVNNTNGYIYLLYCKICSKSFPTSQQLHKHFEFKHSLNLKALDQQKCGKIEISNEQDQFTLSVTCLFCNIIKPSVHKFREHLFRYHLLLIKEYLSKDVSIGVHSYEELNLNLNEPSPSEDDDYNQTEDDNQTKADIMDKVVIRVKEFPCTECNQTFPCTFTLSNHIRTHSTETFNAGPFNCTFCHKSFSAMHLLRNHIRGHTGEKPFKCSKCDSKFARFASLHEHTKRVHTNGRSYECLLCNRFFQYREKLNRHMTIHTGIKKYTCRYCKVGFQRKDSFTRHEAVHKAPPTYKCKYCTRLFAFRKGKTEHERVEHQSNLPKYRCSICHKHDQVFSSIRERRQHIIDEHPQFYRDNKCSYCSRIFLTSSILEKHKAKHSIPVFQCKYPKCMHTFTCVSLLNIHMKKTHIDNIQYACDSCDMVFDNEVNLAIHFQEHMF